MSIPQEADSAREPVPFFTDPRTLIQKLNVQKRDWIPTKPAEGCPPIIHGLVLERGTYTDLNGEPAPTLRLLTDDLKTEWGVIGFHGWLRRGMTTQDPQPGDYVLLSYAGTKAAKKMGNNDAYMYEVLVERNPAAPSSIEQPAESSSTSVESADSGDDRHRDGGGDRSDRGDDRYREGADEDFPF